MKLTPRLEETSRIEALLESVEFTSSKAMATAIIKATAEILSMRDTYALVLRFGDQQGINFGPYASEVDAHRMGNRLAGAAPHTISKLYSPGYLLAQFDGHTNWPDFCICTHNAAMHINDGVRRGRCGLTSCHCTAYKKVTK